MTVREWFRLNRADMFTRELDVLIRFTAADVYIRDIHGIRTLTDSPLPVQPLYTERLKLESLIEQLQRDMKLTMLRSQIVA